MAATREELALDLSRALLASQEGAETQLRSRALKLLQAATVVVPVAGIAIAHGPRGVIAPLAIAAVSYLVCVWNCAGALRSRDFKPGIRGGALVKEAKEKDATVEHMQEAASWYLDQAHEHNRGLLDGVSKQLDIAVGALAFEIVCLTVALSVTVAS